MPVNIPSPISGAGGGGGSRPWFEQLLLTLASQGPQQLLAWMEHRQVAQQQQAIDAASQGALAAEFGGTLDAIGQGGKILGAMGHKFVQGRIEQADRDG